MQPHHQGGAVANGALVVGDGRAVRASGFLHGCAASGPHIEHAERPLQIRPRPARNQDFPSAGEGVQNEQHRGRAVVDHGRPFRAGEVHQQVCNRFLAGTTIALGEVVFEVERLGRRACDRLDRRLRQQRASEMRVHEQSRGVHHPLQADAAGRRQP
jgi:hypothetical protein